MTAAARIYQADTNRATASKSGVPLHLPRIKRTVSAGEIVGLHVYWQS
jgi:hypothetical protein